MEICTRTTWHGSGEEIDFINAGYGEAMGEESLIV